MIAWARNMLIWTAALFVLCWMLYATLEADAGERQAWDEYVRRNYAGFQQ